MRAAFSIWNARIAPVFDTARQIVVVETESGRLVGHVESALPEGLPVQKVMGLVDLGVVALVCGAISRPLHVMVTAFGIRVIPFVAGPVSEVAQSWLSGDLERGAFAMPGCGRRRGRGRGRQAGGAVAACVCVACGHREPHERGVRCAQRRCPVCGANMHRDS